MLIVDHIKPYSYESELPLRIFHCQQHIKIAHPQNLFLPTSLIQDHRQLWGRGTPVPQFSSTHPPTLARPSSKILHRIYIWAVGTHKTLGRSTQLKGSIFNCWPRRAGADPRIFFGRESTLTYGRGGTFSTTFNTLLYVKNTIFRVWGGVPPCPPPALNKGPSLPWGGLFSITFITLICKKHIFLGMGGFPMAPPPP